MSEITGKLYCTLHGERATVCCERVERRDTYVDKSDWKPGPWKSEPDYLHWIDRETKLDCLIVRGGGGALCGYVGVGEKHPLFEVDYDATYEQHDLRVHGGLTYAAFCAERGHICHLPHPGRSDRIWWLGFDCSHCDDLRPDDFSRFPSLVFGGSGVYRDLSYVKSEVTSLAKQIAEIKS